MQRLKVTLTHVQLFIGAFILATLLNSFVWGYCIEGVVYFRQPLFDPVADYPFGSPWIAENAVMVSSIDHTWSIKHPQQVLSGWTNRKLIMVWWAMFGVSLAFAFLVSWWLGKNTKKEPAE